MMDIYVVKLKRMLVMLIAITVAVVACVSLSACNPSSSGTGDELSTVKETKKAELDSYYAANLNILSQNSVGMEWARLICREGKESIDEASSKDEVDREFQRSRSFISKI